MILSLCADDEIFLLGSSQPPKSPVTRPKTTKVCLLLFIVFLFLLFVCLFLFTFLPSPVQTVDDDAFEVASFDFTAVSKKLMRKINVSHIYIYKKLTYFLFFLFFFFFGSGSANN